MKRKRWKSAAAWLTLLMLFATSMPVMAETDKDTACITFGNTEQAFMLSAKLGNSAQKVIVDNGGREALYVSPFEEGKGCNLYFKVNEAFGREYKDGTSVEISVTYYDDGTGCFALVYDKLDGTAVEQDDFIVDMTDTGEWITHTFFVENPLFGGGVEGYDFALMLSTTWMGKSEDYVTISSVEVKKAETKSMAELSVKTENPGNIFFKGDTISFENTFNSITGKGFSADVIYTVYCGNTAIWSRTDKLEIKADEPTTARLEPDFNHYGVFRLKTELINGELKQYSSETVPFSYVNRGRGLPANDDYGVCVHHTLSAETRGTGDIPMELLKNAGFGWIRSNISWPTYERNVGEYKMMDYQDAFDKLLTEKYDKNWMIVATDGNTVRNVDRPVVTDEGRELFAEYIYHLVLDMKKRGINYIQIWNEYNLSAAELETAPEEYAKLLKVSYQAAKRANPDVVVAGLTTSGVPLEWIERVFKAGGIDYMDVATCHPYTWRTSPEGGNYIGMLQNLKALCAKYGKPDMPIWVTEVGYPTGTGNKNLFEMGNDLGETAKAAYITRQYILTNVHGIPDKLFLYEFHKGRHIRNNTEMNFGLIDPYRLVDTPYAAHEGYAAVANMNTLLQDADYKETLELSEGVNAYRFTKGNDSKDVIAIWSLDLKSKADLQLGTDKITVYDMYGNAEERTGVNGNYTIDLSGETTYIEGNFTKLEKGTEIVGFDAADLDVVPLDRVRFSIKNKANQALTVNAEAGAYTQVAEVGQFNGNGDGYVDFSITENKPGNLTIKFTDSEGRLYTKIQPRINASDAMEIQIECLPYSTDMLTRWKGIITLKNNSSVSPVSGKIHFSAPENIAGKMPVEKIPELAPGETKKISVSFPEMMKKYKSYLAGELILDNGYVQNFKLNIDFIAAPYAETPPAIDGIPASKEWQRGSAIFIDRYDMVQMMTDWRGVDDLSGRVYTKWDYDYLYISSVIKDDVHCQDEIESFTWRGDGFQMGIECNMKDEAVTFTEMTVALTKDGPQIFRNRTEGEHSIGAVENFEGVFIRNEDNKTTVYELKIPWTELLPPDCEIEANSKLGFSLLINDNDGNGRRGWMEMTPGIGWYKNGGEFTRILLLK